MNRWDLSWDQFGPLTFGEMERRRKLSEAMKAYWTHARRARASKLARVRNVERMRMLLIKEKYSAAIKEAYANHWDYIQIESYRAKHWRLSLKIGPQFNDSADWDYDWRSMTCKRVRRYGAPIETGAKP